MARFDLSDKEWALIEPLLPNTPLAEQRLDRGCKCRGMSVLEIFA